MTAPFFCFSQFPLFIGEMINISPYTKDIETIATALNGKWERGNVTKNGKSATWVILGQIAFVEGDSSLFPYNVIKWHAEGSGAWGILR